MPAATDQNLGRYQQPPRRLLIPGAAVDIPIRNVCGRDQQPLVEHDQVYVFSGSSARGV